MSMFQSDDDISSDTDSENEKKPPEKITIERSADLDTLVTKFWIFIKFYLFYPSFLLQKKAFLSAEGKPVIRQDKDLDSVRIDKKFFNEIASTFEKPSEDSINEPELKKIEREKIILDKVTSLYNEKFFTKFAILGNLENNLKEAYAASKSKFDSTNLAGEEDNNLNKPKIEIERSESDKKRIQKVFYQVLYINHD